MTRINFCIACLLTICVALFCVSCGSQRRIETNMTQAESQELAQGRILFKTHCQKCHPDGESGVGPPLNNIRLPGFLARTKIRHRAFLLYAGRMPAFKKDEISKQEMDALFTFIKKLRQGKSSADVAKN